MYSERYRGMWHYTNLKIDWLFWIWLYRHTNVIFTYSFQYVQYNKREKKTGNSAGTDPTVFQRKKRRASTSTKIKIDVKYGVWEGLLTSILGNKRGKWLSWPEGCVEIDRVSVEVWGEVKYIHFSEKLFTLTCERLSISQTLFVGKLSELWLL